MADTRAVRKDAGHPKEPTHDKVFRDFGGINTQANRQAIGPSEFSWIENVMPIGHGNALIVAAPSAALQTVASGICYNMVPFNLLGVSYMLMFTTTGHAYQVKLDSPYTRTEITTGGFLFSFSGVTAAPWRNERVLIVDQTKGFFDWDGTTLTGPGTVMSVVVTTGGAYVGGAFPTVAFAGGGGGGAAATANVGFSGAQAIGAGGAGYVVGDILTAVGGTFTSPGKFKVQTIGGGGAVTAVTVYDPGSYSALIATYNVTGGSGSGCQINGTNYAVLSVTITNVGSGYTSAPTVTFSAGTAGNTATGTAFLVSAPTNPYLVAVYADRAWVISGNGRTLSNSAPGTYHDFSSPGSGTKIITSEALNGSVRQLFVANNFLYYIGIDSVNAIGDVQLDQFGSTIYSDTNLTAAVGTAHAQSIIAYYRSIMFSSPSGVYSMSGSTPIKASDALDGVFKNVNLTGTFSGATFVLNNILCAGFMVDYVVGSVHRSLINVFFNKKWFLASQGDQLLFIVGAVDATGIQKLYSTDGTSLFRLFDNPATAVNWELQTAYWDMDSLGRGKQVVSFGFEIDVPLQQGVVHVALDMLKSQPDSLTNSYVDSQGYDVDLAGAQQLVIWINNSGATVGWVNNSGATVQWGRGPGSSYTMNLQDGDAFGKYIGMTLTSSNVLGTLSSTMLRYFYREQW